MTARPRRPAQEVPPSSVEGWALTEIVTRLRRVLRSSVRSDYPWERLPMAQVEVLQRLADEPGLRITDIAERHRLATNTVSNLIQHMVVGGLVARHDDPTDRRAVTLELTKTGREHLQGWIAANSRRLDAALRDLPAADRHAIQSTLPSLALLVERLERADRDGEADSDRASA